MMRYLSLTGICVLAWLLAGIATLLTMGRLLINYKLRKRLALCDVLNGVAAVFMIAFFGTWQAFFPPQYQAAIDHVERPWNMPQIDIMYGFKMNIANGVLFWACIYSVKASFLAMYWSIFGRTDTCFKHWWRATVLYVCAAFITTIIARITVCGWPSDLLNLDECRQNAWHRNMSLMVVWCIVDGLGDVFLTILPITMLGQMFMCTRQKVQLGFLFGMVGVNITTNILRTVFTIDRDLEQVPHLNATWTILQITTAVIICALPCYGSQLTRKRPKTQDGLRIVNNFGSSLPESFGDSWPSDLDKMGKTPYYSLDAFKIESTRNVRHIPSPTPPRYSIMVQDEVRQNASTGLSPGRDRRAGQSVAIWSD